MATITDATTIWSDILTNRPYEPIGSRSTDKDIADTHKSATKDDTISGMFLMDKPTTIFTIRNIILSRMGVKVFFIVWTVS
jgi:hypothetical protein